MPKVSADYFNQKREEIINAAYKVALTKSISSITLKDVRDEAGLARGGMYRYYNNLDEILGALILKINGDNLYSDDINEILIDKKSTSRKPKTVLKALCELLSEYLTSRNSEILILGIQFEVFCIHEPERSMSIMEGIKDKYENSNIYLFTALTDYINSEISKGTMKPVMPVDELIEYFFTIYKGILFQYTIMKSIQPNEKYDTKSIYKALYETMVALLGCK